MDEFGNRLVTWRKRRGYTQAELAVKLQMNLSNYKQLEYKTQNPRIDTLESILIALDLKFDEFYPELCSKVQELSGIELDLFSNFNLLSDEQKAKVIDLIKSM